MRFIFIVAFLFLFKILYSQSQQLLFCSEFNNKEQNEFMGKNKIQNFYCIYSYEFISKDSFSFSKSLMEKALNKDIPDKNQKGFATLDWEGEAYLILVGRKNVSEANYNNILLSYINALQWAKKLRPNIKWSYYNLPLINYYEYKKNENKTRALKCFPLLKELDFFTPSTYILFDKRHNNSIIYQFIDSNVLFALEIGNQLNKPIYPFIMHRYHPDSKTNGWGLIENNYFQTVLHRILHINYRGLMVDGVIWWNVETYLFNNRNKFESISSEYKNTSDYKKHEIEILNNYYNIIKTQINKK